MEPRAKPPPQPHAAAPVACGPHQPAPERRSGWRDAFCGQAPPRSPAPGRLKHCERRLLRPYQLRMMVWSRSGPTVTMLMGAPHSCSRRST